MMNLPAGMSVCREEGTHTHSHTHTQIHTHTHTHTHTHRCSHTLSLSLYFSLFLLCTHTHTVAHTLSFCLSTSFFFFCTHTHKELLTHYENLVHTTAQKTPPTVGSNWRQAWPRLALNVTVKSPKTAQAQGNNLSHTLAVIAATIMR